MLFIIDDSGSAGNNTCGDQMRRQTVIAMVNTMADLATAAPELHDIQFAAVRFSTTSNILFDFMHLGCDKRSVVGAVEAMQLDSVGATLVDSGFAEARTMLTGADTHGFRNFTVPLVVVTITDGDTLEAPRLLETMRSHPFNKSSEDLLLLSVDDGVLLGDTEESGDADDYYKNYYSSAESIAVTFGAIGRDHQFSYVCEGKDNDATLRNLTKTILDSTPCTAMSPTLCSQALVPPAGVAQELVTP